MCTCVDIQFECLPLRSLVRMDVPLDAPPEDESLRERVQQAINRHGLYNSYYLRNGRCSYRLVNDDQLGALDFTFEGTLLTDANDRRTLTSDLKVELLGETCDWLTAPIIAWFRETVQRAVEVEFNRYIATCDVAQTVRRQDLTQAEIESRAGFLGMGI